MSAVTRCSGDDLELSVSEEAVKRVECSQGRRAEGEAAPGGQFMFKDHERDRWLLLQRDGPVSPFQPPTCFRERVS